jgi:hypothetical protein
MHVTRHPWGEQVGMLGIPFNNISLQFIIFNFFRNERLGQVPYIEDLQISGWLNSKLVVIIGVELDISYFYFLGILVFPNNSLFFSKLSIYYLMSQWIISFSKEEDNSSLPDSGSHTMLFIFPNFNFKATIVSFLLQQIFAIIVHIIDNYVPACCSDGDIVSITFIPR